MPRGRKAKPVEERFWSYVRKPADPDACWEWTGGRNEFGYGLIVKGPKKEDGKIRAHRLSWEIAYGPVPEGKDILHRCIATPWCVNPAHLYPGNDKDNRKDCKDQDRHERGSRHWNAKLTEDQVASIRKQHATGAKQGAELAREYGVGQSTIHWIVTGRNWHHAGSGEPEDAEGKDRLTAEQVAEIRACYAARNRVSQLQLARRFGVSKRVISDIVHYRAWKDTP